MDEHGGNIEKAVRVYRLKKDKVIDFSANINPLGIPSSIKKAITKALDCADRYPEPEYRELRNGLALFYGVGPNELLPDNGSISLIYLIPRALGLRRPLVPVPAFSEYEKSLRLNNCRPLFVKPKADLGLDAENIIKQLKNADSLYLCNPNNPTGLMLAKEDLIRIIKKAEAKKITVVLDEVFIEFTDASQKNTCLREAVKSKNLIILRSLTKYFALAGLRLGAAIAHRDTILGLKKYQPPWAVNSLAVAAAGEFIKDKKYIHNSYRLIARERGFLYSSLAALSSLQVWKPSANFIFCQIKDRKINSGILRDSLARKGVLIRDCSNFRGLNNRFFRVAVRTRPENLKLLESLPEVLH